MKFALVVATGVHAGKEIAVPGPSLVIGRAEGCHLRPASPAISNRHCEVFSRGDEVFVRDFGSTNGTQLNDVPVSGEVPVKTGDRLKVGPLDFTVKLTRTLAAGSTGNLKPASQQTPVATAKPGESKAVPAAQKPAEKPAPKPLPKAPVAAGEDEAMAAMLMGMDDEDPVEVPGGSTVMELPAVDAAALAKAAADAKKTPQQADSASAARDLLSRYTQRPRK